MKSWIAFFKKEMLESVRSGKLTVLSILFLIFGIMNPAIAKLTPWMLELLSSSLTDNGILVTEATINALTSWTQFFKNIEIAFLIFVLIFSGIFTREYQSGTLILMLTKGLSRSKVVLAKFAAMLFAWTLDYWLCFAVTYGYNSYFWDNRIVVGLAPAAVHWWLFGIWTICVMVLFSALSKSHTGVLLGTGGSVFGMYLLSFFPKIRTYTPIAFMKSAPLLTGAPSMEIYRAALLITILMCVSCLIVSIAVLNKRQF